jgi:hypothetical protein
VWGYDHDLIVDDKSLKTLCSGKGKEHWKDYLYIKSMYVRILHVKHYLRTEASYPTPISSMEQ